MLVCDEYAGELPGRYPGHAQALREHAALKAGIDQYAGAALWPRLDQQGIPAASTTQ
jgi:hypothetical protein